MKNKQKNHNVIILNCKRRERHASVSLLESVQCWWTQCFISQCCDLQVLMVNFRKDSTPESQSAQLKCQDFYSKSLMAHCLSHYCQYVFTVYDCVLGNYPDILCIAFTLGQCKVFITTTATLADRQVKSQWSVLVHREFNLVGDPIWSIQPGRAELLKCKYYTCPSELPSARPP